MKKKQDNDKKLGHLPMSQVDLNKKPRNWAIRNTGYSYRSAWILDYFRSP